MFIIMRSLEYSSDQIKKLNGIKSIKSESDTTGVIRFIFHRHIILMKMASISTKTAFFAIICISFSNAGEITELTEDCGNAWYIFTTYKWNNVLLQGKLQ